jgi:hypothetical protein
VLHRRGIALILTLSIGAVLVILATSLVGLFFGEYHAQRSQQQAIQAYWDARSGIERYCDNYKLPEPPVYDLGRAGNCKVIKQPNGDLLFEGQCGAMIRRISLSGGDPAKARELP